MVHSATGVKLVQVYHRIHSLDLFFSMYILIYFMAQDTAKCNFADDTTVFAADGCLDKVSERLETDALVL